MHNHPVFIVNISVHLEQSDGDICTRKSQRRVQHVSSDGVGVIESVSRLQVKFQQYPEMQTALPETGRVFVYSRLNSN